MPLFSSLPYSPFTSPHPSPSPTTLPLLFFPIHHLCFSSSLTMMITCFYITYLSFSLSHLPCFLIPYLTVPSVSLRCSLLSIFNLSVCPLSCCVSVYLSAFLFTQGIDVQAKLILICRGDISKIPVCMVARYDSQQ